MHLLGLLAIAIMFMPMLAHAQDYQVVKSKRSESFVLPYTASNADIGSPLVYTYDEPKGPSWILNVRNNMSYVASEDAKTIIKIREQAGEKFIEIAMFGEESGRFWVAASTPEAGYARIYDQSIEGWSRERPVSVTYADNQGLIVTNGKRTVVDRLDLDGFTVSSISVYGNDGELSANTYAGYISFEILFGSFDESPLYYVPLGVMLGVGGLVIGLLVFKKRKPE